MSIEDLAGQMELETAKLKAKLGEVAPAHKLIEDLHGIPFTQGETVVDLVTGLEGEVLGSGIENVAPMEE